MSAPALRRVVLKTDRSLDGDSIVIDVARYRIGLNGGWSVEGNTLSFRFRSFVCVAAATSGFCEREDMIEFIYGDDPDGGPLDPWRRVANYFHANRRWLARAGIACRNRWGVGFETRFIDQKQRMAA